MNIYFYKRKYSLGIIHFSCLKTQTAVFLTEFLREVGKVYYPETMVLCVCVCV